MIDKIRHSYAVYGKDITDQISESDIINSYNDCMFVGLNPSREFDGRDYGNFHSNSINDKKLRYAFENTPKAYGAFLCDLESVIDGNSNNVIISNDSISKFDKLYSEMKPKTLFAFGNKVYKALKNAGYNVHLVTHFAYRFRGYNNFDKYALKFKSQVESYL